MHLHTDTIAADCRKSPLSITARKSHKQSLPLLSVPELRRLVAEMLD